MTKLYDPQNGQMRVAGLMSGSGTNLVKIIEHEKKLQLQKGQSPYTVAAIFSDRPDSRACDIGKEYDIPAFISDIRGFYARKKKPLKDMDVRREFDHITVQTLSFCNIHAAAYAGYMSIATAPLVNAFIGVNVHPADLTIIRQDGRRKYTGDHAVRDAILAGDASLRSTTHIITEGVDEGQILMLSAPMKVSREDDQSYTNETSIDRIAAANQDRLKKVGDWVIFPLTLQYIAEGKYAKDKAGNLYFEGTPIPCGVQLK